MIRYVSTNVLTICPALAFGSENGKVNPAKAPVLRVTGRMVVEEELGR